LVFQQTIEIATRGRGTHELTAEVNAIVSAADIVVGTCHVFVHHTSASLILSENADPQVRRDLESFMERLVPDGDPMFRHVQEGEDDMPAHVRSVLTQSAITVPIQGGRCVLGTWQGIYLWEHRTAPHRRRITVTVSGE
jgi:secondary thiamine-phosphate synthase enzyme